MPQFAVLIYADDSKHAPDAAQSDLADCDQHADDMRATEAMTAAWALTPRDMAKSVRPHATTDGPFVESTEIVAGFYILEAPDIETAIELAGTNPVLREGGGLEVRPVHSGGVVERSDD